jgi:RecA-family ATPase
MAIEKPKPSLINELVDIETSIKEAGAAYEKAKRNQVFMDRKKQEQAIVDFKLQLEQSSVKITNEQRKKLEKEFIREIGRASCRERV